MLPIWYFEIICWMDESGIETDFGNAHPTDMKKERRIAI